jgi:hypothetical protein
MREGGRDSALIGAPVKLVQIRDVVVTAVVNALAKAGVELGENGSIFPRPKGKTR